MAKNDQIVGPYWTKHWIEKMWRYTSEKFVDFDTGAVDFEALGREEYEFRKALFYRNFKNSPRAKEAFEETAAGYKTYVENGKKGGRPRKNQESTADGDIREDSQDIATSGNGSVTESGTSANLYGDAPHREAGDESATISNNSEDRQSRRAGGNSLRVAKVSTSPARSSGRISRCPNSREDFHAFVADNNLHEGLAEEWYAMHEARGWVDKNGNPIKDWRGALYNYCTKTEQKRRTA